MGENEREAIPAELAQALAESVEGRQLFEALPAWHQREYVRWISQAKKTGTMLSRARRCLAMLIEQAE